MKYGIVIVTPVTTKQDRNFINIGDMFQSFGVMESYKEMGIDDDDIIRIDFNELKSYDREYVILPININLSLNWIVDVFPLSPRIIPVFLGLSYFAAERIPEKVANYFRIYAPIGCRDEQTFLTMQENGIPAYIFGCMSTVLPMRSSRSAQKRVFFVDVPQSFLSFASNYIEDNCENIEFMSHITNEAGVRDMRFCEELARHRLQRYRDEAALIVTSRLHCMAVCIAMGIPVIAVTDNISPRFGFIDAFLPVFTPDRYDEISFSGYVIDMETVKKRMLEIATDEVKKAAKTYEKKTDLSYRYETRTRSLYGNYYIEKLAHVNRKNIDRYILWGAGQIGMSVYKVLQEWMPNATCVAVIDSYCSGTFHGIEINRPEVLQRDSCEFIFITTFSGQKAAEEMMKSLGKQEYLDYICMGTSVG